MWPEWSPGAVPVPTPPPDLDLDPDIGRPRLPGYLGPLLRPDATGSPAFDVADDDGGPATPAVDRADDGAEPPVTDLGRPPAAPESIDHLTPFAESEPGSGSGRTTAVVGLAVGLVLIVTIGLVSVSLARLVSGSDQDSRPVPAGAVPAGSTRTQASASASPSASAPGNAVSGPLGGLEAAEFQLVGGGTEVVVRTADIGDDLYRAVTPETSSFVPLVEQDGTQVRLQLAKLRGGDSRDTVTVELNVRVRWKLNLIAGSHTVIVDVRTANLAGVDFTGGVARIELWLPKPQGLVAVRMSGGARDFTVHAPGGIPVRAVLARGAAKVTIDGVARSGIATGTRFTPPGWARAADRYDIDAAAGLAELVVDRY
jgi:hypothetical protein